MATVNTSRFKTDDNGRHYIVVIWNDTLSEIAEAYRGWSGTHNANVTVEDLGLINSLDDVDVIVVDETLYMEPAKSGSGTTTPSSSLATAAYIPEVPRFGLLTGFERKLYAAWTCPTPREQTAKFDVEWRAYRSGLWMNEYRVDKEVDVDRQNDTYDIPDDDLIQRVQFRVCPVPKVKEKREDGTEIPYFTRNYYWTDWNSNEYYVINRPDIPSTLKIELKLLLLTAKVTGIDTQETKLVEFKLVADGNEETASIQKAMVDTTGEASTTFIVDPGTKYKVCCRSKSINTEYYSEWSAYTDSKETQPTPVELKDPVAKSSSSIYVEWSKSATATSYTLEYTADKNGFYEGADITPLDTSALNRTVNKLAIGNTYHFRVKAKNDKGEESDWSEVKTCSIGSDPAAPTTWSSTTTAISDEGETVSLYWLHNSTDGSAQTSATVTLKFEGIDDISLVQHDVDVDYGTIESIVPTGNTVVYTITASTEESEKNATHSLIINTKNYADGAKITWNVATVGLVDGDGNGRISATSVDRVVYIYSKPTVYMTVSDPASDAVGTLYYKVDYLAESDTYVRTEETLDELNGTPISATVTIKGKSYQVRTAKVNDEDIFYCMVEQESLRSFPFSVNVKVVTATDIQYPIEYHLTITPNNAYETVDIFGNHKNVTEEELLYSKHFTAAPSSTTLNAEISAKDVDLVNGQTYTVKCVVAMNSGIVVEASTEVHISWSSEPYLLNADISHDKNKCSVTIRPYCESVNNPYYKVDFVYGRYTVDTTVKYDYVYGSIVAGAYTSDNDPVYRGSGMVVDADGNSTTMSNIYYTVRRESELIKNVLLGVYRREYDGTFTEIVSNLDASLNSSVLDRYPSLDYARYRITAKNESTGIVNYMDLPNYPIGEKAIVIQWDEPPTTYSISEDEFEETDKAETVLKLLYNIDVTTSRDPDVSLIKYIGRKHPVSYYGTQVGEKASWSTVVPKSDTETLYTLQRLQAWSGDVYVREPSGIGFLAHVTVSMSKNHLETVVPVTLDITRVEGGV